MKKTKKLMDHIAEEINDAEEYIRDAEACKENDSEVADTYCRLAEEELGHMAMLHKQVTRVIEAYRKTNGSPPAEMQARYDVLHEVYMEHVRKVRMMIQMYKEG